MPPSPSPAPSPTPVQEPFRITFSGTLDATNQQSVPLEVPFDIFRAPMTQEVVFDLSPNFRDTIGGFGVQIWDQTTDFGFEFQVGSQPDTIFVTVLSDWGTPIDPDQVPVTAVAYRTPCPTGLPGTIRVVIGADLVARVFFDGVELVWENVETLEQILTPGNMANVYAFSAGDPGKTVDIQSLVITNGAILPPAPV